MTPHPLTTKSIELQPKHHTFPDEMKVCGCWCVRGRWRLCKYHQGYDDAITDQWATVVENAELYGQVWFHVKDGHA